MTWLTSLRSRITNVDLAVAATTRQMLDAKTKPRGSLGRLEELACRLAAIYREPRRGTPRKAIVVLGADHGVAAEAVSAYPAEVTRQMLLNFVAGGAAINVLARQAGAALVVADMGLREPLPAGTQGVRSLRLGPGTRNFLHAWAMERDVAEQAIRYGIDLVTGLVRDGVDLVGLGDMGIGNSTAASALAALFTGAPVAEVTGHGTGIDDATFARKINVIERALAAHAPCPNDPLACLAAGGGFEIAGLVGVTLGAAAHRVPVVVDGFITGVAALAAVRLVPQCAGYLVPAHRSVEAGHRLVLQALGVRPLLDLDLRLGEGSGAALAMPIIDAALAVVRDMATFASAGVSDAGA